MKCLSLSLVLLLVAVAANAEHQPKEKRDGSTITVSTTAFNPALTNQGGTTNAAGTFNVSPLATSTSYQFQTLQQTSTFQVGPANTQAPSSGGSAGANEGNGNASASGGGGINGGNVGGGTVVVTATAPTSTVNMASGGSSRTDASGSGVVTASNGLPSLALGSQNTNAASQQSFGKDTFVAWSFLIATTVGAALII
ncbi:uncharacterized protein UTRI_10352_B [Ustilago trichophora]|uniref:Uncharacterized protein n=1 Tax=Ustilago trichophora TaxID=86804 RepID=A0A5C3ECM0_9BASI|nr:uncharacterized protein UTRI_10352_B [Ustilago trichophora]